MSRVVRKVKMATHFLIAAKVDPVSTLLRSSLIRVHSSLKERRENVSQGEEQAERSCVQALLTNVGTVWLKMCHTDFPPYPLCVLVLKLALAPYYFWAAPSCVHLAPKTAWVASQDKRVFQNLLVPVWERKSFQILSFSFLGGGSH